jgi:catechol 2,3-dioxygenase
MTITLQTGSPAFLHHLHITSEDPARLAAFYADQLSLMREEKNGAQVLKGGARSMIITNGPSAQLQCAGYAVADDESLSRLRSTLIERGVALTWVDNPLYRNGVFCIADPQGRKMTFGVPAAPRFADKEPARLQHVVFQTTELENMVRFYVEKIGFTVSDEVMDDDGRVMVVFMRSDDEHHTLAFFRGSRNEWDHHCYETSEWNDIRDWGDKFAKKRIPIFFGPGRHGPGNNLFFMVTDPDGNRLEFSAELQRVTADTASGIWPHGEYTLNSWGRAWIRT